MKCVSYHRVSDELRWQLSVPLSAAQKRAVRSWGTSSPYAGRSSWCPAPYDEIFIIYWHKKHPNTHTHTAQEERMWGTSCNTIKSTGERGEGGRRPAIELSENFTKTIVLKSCARLYSHCPVSHVQSVNKSKDHTYRYEEKWSCLVLWWSVDSLEECCLNLHVFYSGALQGPNAVSPP